MKAATTRLVSLLASLGILGASIFVYARFLAPTYEEVNVLRGDLVSYRDALEDQKKISEQINNFLAEYQSLASLRNTIGRVIPGKEDYSGFVSQLAAIASVSQLRLDSMTMNPLRGRSQIALVASDFPPPSILQVTVAASGSYQALKDFLSSIERNIRIMDLISLSMSSPVGSIQNLSYVIILNGYYQSL